jgi:hypothetical protein
LFPTHVIDNISLDNQHSFHHFILTPMELSPQSCETTKTTTMKIPAISTLTLLSTAWAFSQQGSTARSATTVLLSSPNDNVNRQSHDRRSFLTTGIITAATLVAPQIASAGIDVSGLPVEGGGKPSNPGIAAQLKAYDGSGSARVREIQAMSSPASSSTTNSATSPLDDRSPVATWAYRYNPGIGASLTRAGSFGNLYRYNDNLIAPVNSQRRSIGVQFEFPSDWLQLDRSIGGIQYVDQRNGDKLYVFRAPMPTNNVGDLTTIPKSYIADAIFATSGSFAQSGQTVQDYSVSRANTLSDCPSGTCAPHRRFKLKFTTVTGNGLQVERRGLVDAFQVDNDIYMIMTSSNAVKFEQKDSRERETVENIVSSFVIDA